MRRWFLSALIACTACGGKLDDKERFSVVLAALDSGLGGSSGSAGAPLDSDAATAPTDGGTTPPADAATGAAPPACVQQIFTDTCGVAGCHYAGSPLLDLVADGVAERMLDRAAGPGLCEGVVYVASDGSGSLLLDKLQDMPPCGGRMPLVGDALTADQIECIRSWVDSLTSGGD